MVDSVKLVAESRVGKGTAECRRLRKQGVVPGNLYGMKKDCISIATREDELGNLISSGHRVFDLDIGGKTEPTMFREVQWDTFGKKILHFDLIRIDMKEKITIEVPIVIRGVAPGTNSGGHLHQVLRSLSIETSPVNIPDNIPVRVNELEIDDSLSVKDLEVGASITVLTPEDTTVVHVLAVVEEPDETEEHLDPIEPEVIGKKKEDDEEGGNS